MSNVTEFTPTGEVCTATLHQPHPPFDGEAVVGPLHIGYYPPGDQPEPAHELWIEQDGRRVQVYVKYLPDLIKQLRRAQKLAKAAMP